jgi:hypothetical protein
MPSPTFQSANSKHCFKIYIVQASIVKEYWRELSPLPSWLWQAIIIALPIYLTEQKANIREPTWERTGNFGKFIENTLGTSGTWWELVPNWVGTDPKKNPNPLNFPLPPPKPKRKKLSTLECMLSVHIGCMKLLIVCHHLQFR